MRDASKRDAKRNAKPQPDLTDQYIDDLHRNPFTPEPDGLDSDTARTIRDLMEVQQEDMPDTETQNRVWNRVLFALHTTAHDPNPPEVIFGEVDGVEEPVCVPVLPSSEPMPVDHAPVLARRRPHGEWVDQRDIGMEWKTMMFTSSLLSSGPVMQPIGIIQPPLSSRRYASQNDSHSLVVVTVMLLVLFISGLLLPTSYSDSSPTIYSGVPYNVMDITRPHQLERLNGPQPFSDGIAFLWQQPTPYSHMTSFSAFVGAFYVEPDSFPRPE